jgi:hypothetical protein
MSHRHLTPCLSRLAASLGLLCAATAGAQTVTVPGTSNPKLAGMPDGTTASAGDEAPAQSPVLVGGLGLVAGSTLQFLQVSGLVDNCPSGCSQGGPDGNAIDNFVNGAENGISGMSAPLNALVGVFLCAAQPDGVSAPAALDFSTAASRSFASLAPALQQVFFIGDGLTGTGSGAVQGFQVPVGATRLYLATHDGYGWFNNSGNYTVTVAVPVPANAALLLAGLALVAGVARRRR